MQKRNIDWFRLKHKTNNFNKRQNNDRRVCSIEKKDSARSWQRNHFSKTPNKTSQDKPCVKTGCINLIFTWTTRKIVLVPIDKAANNIAIICKKHYVIAILQEIGILDAGNETYEKVNKNQEEIIEDNLEYNARLKLSNGSKDKSLPIMYRISKWYKYPISSPFIIGSKNCSTKPLSKAISSVVKLIYSHTENFHRKSKFLPNYNKFWVL